MDSFQEFDQPLGPERSSGAIISHAFEMYKGIFLYALLATAIYFLASFLVSALSGFDTQSFSEEIISADGDFSSMKIRSYPGLGMYYGLSGLVGILLTPLIVGVIYIANKFNNKELLQIGDLFIGYRQNTLNILIYALISGIITAIAFALCVLPGFFVLPLFLLGYPILLFENAGFAEALSKTFQIAKENYGTFLGATILGLLISVAGILLCGIGIIATFPFYIVVMYSAYCAFLGKPKVIHPAN